MSAIPWRLGSGAAHCNKNSTFSVLVCHRCAMLVRLSPHHPHHHDRPRENARWRNAIGRRHAHRTLRHLCAHRNTCGAGGLSPCPSHAQRQSPHTASTDHQVARSDHPKVDPVSCMDPVSSCETGINIASLLTDSSGPRRHWPPRLATGASQPQARPPRQRAPRQGRGCRSGRPGQSGRA